MNYENQKQVHLMVWEENPNKRNTNNEIKFNVPKETIIITGGVGSFGQAITKRLLAKEDVKAIRIFSRDEYKQAEINCLKAIDRLLLK